MENSRRSEWIESSIIHDLVDFGGRDVLEIGCGDGRVTWLFADRAASVMALDPKEDRISCAHESIPDELRPIVTFQVGDITRIELPKASFDVALLSWSL